MPHSSELLLLAIESIQPDNYDDALEKLRFFFPDTLLIAALDLIDRDSVIKHVTPWGHLSYEVYGLTANYAVFPDICSSGLGPLAYCTCPAYAYSVLLSRSQIMCKHLLATIIAQRLSKCIERPIHSDELAAIIVRQYT